MSVGFCQNTEIYVVVVLLHFTNTIVGFNGVCIGFFVFLGLKQTEP